jgi:glycosyltransferase involved in cell wall biosynthesis
MRIGVVVPRYGARVIGGAEYAARLVAEKLASIGHGCEVFTTCATDASTWANELPAGSTVEQGVTVHRFESRSGRGRDFARCSAAVLADPARSSAPDAFRWVEQLGPVCPAAVDAAAASDCEVVAFHPYLYHPTVTGVPRLGRRAVLHPAAHDEPPIHLPVFRDVFGTAGALAYWTHVEQRTATRLFPFTAATPQLVAGIGIEPGPDPPDAAAIRSQLGIGDRPFLLCLGKTLQAKGTNALADAFRAHKRRHPGPLALVFAGPVVDVIEPDDDVLVLGAVDDRVKWRLLRDALVLVSPSPLESLSLVLLEAWSVSTPVLVTAACEVTRDHCERSGGGLWFDSVAAFSAAVARLEADAPLRTALGAAGHAYVEARYRWSQVLDRYVTFLERVATRAAA